MIKQSGLTETIPTVIHVRDFDMGKSGDAAELAKLKKTLAAQHCYGPVWAGDMSYHLKLAKLDGQVVELELAHLFDDQWNTAPVGDSFPSGLRVFDFALYQFPQNRSRYQVQWLELDARHAELRNAWTKCGYCGALEHAAKGYTFCPHCLGSECLKKSDLKLLRMKYIGDSFGNRAELTDAEKEYLFPLYKEAQLHGNSERDKARIAKARADLIKERDATIKTAHTKFDGFSWLMDKGLKTDNVIYYSHTGRFSFGWRQPVDADIVLDILEVISEFPYSYEIKCADGRLLQGDR